MGKVAKSAKSSAWNNFSVRDTVLVVSADYRDFRKAASRQYAVASSFNAVKLPSVADPSVVAGVGVAFVTAAITLGISLGVVFPQRGQTSSIDLLSITRSQSKGDIPEDVASEVFDGLSAEDKA